LPPRRPCRLIDTDAELASRHCRFLFAP
jgi:hypothetical protein